MSDCEDGSTCDNGQCVCAPACAGKQCGPDGCDGVCGACPFSAPYCVGGLCATECVPDCATKTCGDDGCGEPCGECDEADALATCEGGCVGEEFVVECIADICLSGNNLEAEIAKAIAHEAYLAQLAIERLRNGEDVAKLAGKCSSSCCARARAQLMLCP